MFGNKAIFMLCIFNLLAWDAGVSVQAQSTIMPERELQISSSGVLGLSGSVTLEKSEIPLSIAECGLMCYKLKRNVELDAGEYVISPVNSNDSFTFGVDAIQKNFSAVPAGSNP